MAKERLVKGKKDGNEKKKHMFMSKKREKELDKKLERMDNISVVVMVVILILCFVVGISLGYLLWKIAINGAI